MPHSNNITVAAVALGLAGAVLYASLGQPVWGGLSARSFLLLGIWPALGLSLCSAFCAALARRTRVWQAKKWPAKLVCAVFWLWFLAQLLRTMAQAQLVALRQFGSPSFLGVLPLVLWFGWGMDGAACSRGARLLWWLVLLGAAAYLAAAGAHLQWQRLAAAPLTPADLQALPLPPVYPEYFAWPLFTAPRQRRAAVWLPVYSFALQAGILLAAELVFGTGGSGGHLRYELLALWGAGGISRLDALLMFLWLCMALYRICFLLAVLRQLGRRLGRRTAFGKNCAKRQKGACG